MNASFGKRRWTVKGAGGFGEPTTRFAIQGVRGTAVVAATKNKTEQAQIVFVKRWLERAGGIGDNYLFTATFAFT